MSKSVAKAARLSIKTPFFEIGYAFVLTGFMVMLCIECISKVFCMITSLHGKVAEVKSSSIILEVQDVGFEVFTPCPHRYSVNEKRRMHIYFQWHPDQGPALYGFADAQQKVMFELIIAAPGVGPKLALAVLAHHEIGGIVRSIMDQKASVFNEVPGIGKKKAEHVLLFLKDKVHELVENGTFKLDDSQHDSYQMSQVLRSLGYTLDEIKAALSHMRQEGHQLPFEQQLRKTLNYLSKARK